VTKRYAVAIGGRNRMRTFCIHRCVVTWRRFFGMFAVKTCVRIFANEWKIEWKGWAETR